MSHLIAYPSESNPAARLWLPILGCICVMMAATVSPPEDFKVSSFGTQSLLPPMTLKLLKAVGRGATILVLGYIYYLVWHHPRRWKTAKVLLPIIGFSVFAICSVAWSAEQFVTLSQAATFAILIALAHVISIIWRGEEDTSRLLKCCSIVLFLLSVVLVFLHFAKPELGVLTRNSSGLFHSTCTGATASLGIVIVFAGRLIWGWPWTRWLIAPATVAHLTSMMIGQNRWSIVIMFLVCAILFSTMVHKAVVAATALGLATILVGYICLDPGLVLVDGLEDKMSVAVAQGQTQAQLANLSGRSEMWSKIWDSFLDSPLIGHGYFVTSNTGRLFVWDTWGNWTAHSFYLQLMATMGILGAALFLVGVANVVIRVVSKIGTSEKSVHRLAIFLLAIFIWFVGWGFLNESVLGPLAPESVVFGIALGLGAAISVPFSASSPIEATSPAPGLTGGETQ